MRTVLTPSQENYMEWIFRFGEKGPVRVGDLAKKLGVKLPSVSRAVRGLCKAGLVEHAAYGTIELTDLGSAVGQAIVSRDTCLTSLLVDVMGMDPATADPAVHQMEHVLTDEVLERLEVLVEVCLARPTVRKAIAQRLATKPKRSTTAGQPLVGATNVHAGFAREKSRS